MSLLVEEEELSRKYRKRGQLSTLEKKKPKRRSKSRKKFSKIVHEWKENVIIIRDIIFKFLGIYGLNVDDRRSICMYLVSYTLILFVLIIGLIWTLVQSLENNMEYTISLSVTIVMVSLNLFIYRLIAFRSPQIALNVTSIAFSIILATFSLVSSVLMRESTKLVTNISIAVYLLIMGLFYTIHIMTKLFVLLSFIIAVIGNFALLISFGKDMASIEEVVVNQSFVVAISAIALGFIYCHLLIQSYYTKKQNENTVKMADAISNLQFKHPSVRTVLKKHPSELTQVEMGFKKIVSILLGFYEYVPQSILTTIQPQQEETVTIKPSEKTTTQGYDIESTTYDSESSISETSDSESLGTLSSGELRFKSKRSKYKRRIKRYHRKVHTGDFPFQLGLKKSDLTILLLDIYQLEEMTAKLMEEDILFLFQRFLKIVHKISQHYKGLCQGYVGEKILVTWQHQSTIELENGPTRACKAALAIQRATQKLSKKLSKQNFPHILKSKIAICTGQIIHGNVGIKGLKSHLNVGAPVLRASCFLKMNKMYGSDIMVDGTTMQQCSQDIILQFVDHIRLFKGNSILIYDCKGKILRNKKEEPSEREEEEAHQAQHLSTQVKLLNEVFHHAVKGEWKQAKIQCNYFIEDPSHDIIDQALVDRLLDLVQNADESTIPYLNDMGGEAKD